MFSYFLNEMRNLNEIFKKDMTYDNIKSHKKSEFHLSSEDKFLKKKTQLTPPPPSRSRVNILIDKSYFLISQ